LRLGLGELGVRGGGVEDEVAGHTHDLSGDHHHAVLEPAGGFTGVRREADERQARGKG